MRGTEKQKEWVAFIEAHPGCHQSALVAHFGMCWKTTHRYLQRLEAGGAIASIGEQKSRRWYTVEACPPKARHWSEVAIELVRRPEGASRDEIRQVAGISKQMWDRWRAKCKADGLIAWHGNGSSVRWYAADKQPSAVKFLERTKIARMVPERKLNGFQRHPCTLPGSYGQRKVDGPVIVPAGVKRTQGPNWSHDPRYQCAPGEVPHGAGFVALGVGRYL